MTHPASPEHRREQRERLVARTRLRLDREGAIHSVTIRNLSPAGLMAEGDVLVSPGQGVRVEVPDPLGPALHWLAGTVAWIQDNRFGIAFTHA